MSDGFDELLAQLERWEEGAEADAAEGLRRGATRLENRARASTAYRNRTGATREGTVAFVVGGGRNDGDALDLAVQIVEEQLRAGGDDASKSQTATTDGPADGEVAVYLTVPTTYDDELEARAAHLSPALTAEQLNLLQDAARGLQDGLERSVRP